jgi:hypothetical protein
MNANGHAHHFIDLDDARAIYWALLCVEQGFSHREYKGTPPRNGRVAISRVLSIAVKGENVYIELKAGHGKLTNTGAITPNGPAKVEVNVGFKLYEARRMAASVLAYIHAWDVMRMMVNQQMVSRPMPYASAPLSTGLLVSATNTASGIQAVPPPSDKGAPANGISKPNGATRLPVEIANGRPLTRKDSMPKANGTIVKPAARAKTTPAKPDAALPPTQPLQYNNGSMVDMENLTEVQTFQRYATETKALPKSKTVLLDYYRKGVEATAAAASQ